jgi:hypothetical protein
MDAEAGKQTIGDCIKQLELQGFVLVPDLLSADAREKLVGELSLLPTNTTTYSDKQCYVHGVQWLDCPNVVDTIALPGIVNLLSTLFGDDLICTGCTYARTEPGYPGMALHTDSQPYGSAIFGLQSSSPVLVRVLYYLTDLTPDCAPLRVVPYSHLCLHSDANPYKRYKSNPQEVTVTCKAGTAAIINQKLFHAVGKNTSNDSRHVLAVSYRPAWAGPIAEVPDHDPEKLQKLPPHVAPFFNSLNTRKIDFDVKNYSDDLPTAAPRLGPDRWSLS